MRQVWLGFIVALGLAAAGGRAQALTTLSFQSVSVTAADKKSPAGRIYCGRDPVLTLSGRGWASVNQANELARRLNVFAEAGIQAQEITLWREGKTRVLMIQGERLLVIDRALARSQRSSVDALSNIWLKNLRTQFNKPYLAMDPIVVPLGETRAAPVTGRSVGPVTARIESNVATATWNEAQGALAITGRELGRTTLVVQDRRNQLRVPVRVAKYAGQLVGSLTAVVTGNPASVEAIEAAVRATLDTNLKLEPGAVPKVGVWMGGIGPLPTGRTTAVPGVVAAEGGDDYLTYRVRPLVTVVNEPLTLADTSLLLVSNSPERLRANGLWYEAVLQSDEAARLLYHHVNATDRPAVLSLELWNPTNKPARVHVTAGTAGPSYDEAWVGHRATVQFLENRVRQSGWALTIPPGAAVVAVSQSMPDGTVASGVLELRALGEANVSVRLYLRRAEVPLGVQPIDQYQPAPELGRFQYPQPQREVNVRYEVGGRWAFVTIGDQPAVGKLDGDQLPGSYGVLYDITLELSNPTGAPAEVLLAMEAAGGPARGTLVVDGSVVEVAMVQRDDEDDVLRYLLGPGQTRTVKVQTMPQAGSNYPVRIVARPLS